MRRWMVLIIPAYLTLGILSSAMSQNLEYVGSSLWSLNYDVKIVGSYAYCAYANGLVILNISDPSTPTFCSKTYLPGRAKKLDISGNYVFVADSVGGFQIIDATDIFHPVVMSSYSAEGSANDVFISGNYAYVANDTSGLIILNISDPANPNLIGSLRLPDGIKATAVHVAGDYAYVGGMHRPSDYLGAVYIINISDPAYPLLIRSISDMFSTVTSIDVIDSTLYFDGCHIFGPSREGTLYLYNISNPDTPALITRIRSGAIDFMINGHFAYNLISDGIFIYDIIDPYHPVFLGILGINHSKGIFVRGDYAYVACNSGLKIANILDPNEPTLSGSFESDYAPEDVAVAGGYAYVADANNSIFAIDISNLADPTLVSSCSLPGMALGIKVSGNYAYVADYGDGLQIVDISNPDSMHIVGGIATSGRVFNVFLQGNYAYVVNYDLGLLIVNITDPANPSLAGLYDTEPNSSMNVFVRGNYAYIGGSSNGQIACFKIVNVENPGAPTLVSQSYFQADFFGVDVRDSLAYVSGAPNYFGIIDISNPATPIPLGTYSTQEGAFDVKVVGNYAYVGDGYFGMKVIDISNPFSPSLVSSYFLPDRISHLTIVGDLCYVTGGCSIVIFRINSEGVEDDISCPQNFSLMQNYPNPFNARTIISYNLSEAERVEILIFNILGEKIAALSNGLEQAGYHQVVWDASEEPSGIYIARMESGKRVQNIKMVLLK